MLQVPLSHNLAIALYEGLSMRRSCLGDPVLFILDASLSSILLVLEALQQCKALKQLKLNHHDLVWTMDDCQIVTIMKALDNHESLIELSIQGSSYRQAKIRAISNFVVKGLVKLDLSNHRLGDNRLHRAEHLGIILATQAQPEVPIIVGTQTNGKVDFCPHNLICQQRLQVEGASPHKL
jgi:hypothetical protein